MIYVDMLEVIFSNKVERIEQLNSTFSTLGRAIFSNKVERIEQLNSTFSTSGRAIFSDRLVRHIRPP